MDLWLLRHAAAEDRAASGRDEDRELTAEGTRRAAEVARGLAALEPGIEVIWTSPYRRARQTALPVARALGLEKKLRETRALEPARPLEEILEELRAEKDRNGVLLVGHEPQLGALLGRILTEGDRLEIPLKKAAVAKVEIDEHGSGLLRAFLPARVLEQLGRSKG